MMNKYSFFWLFLNMSESESFSDFVIAIKIEFSCDKLKISVCEALRSVTSVCSACMMLKSDCICSEIMFWEFMSWVCRVVDKWSNNEIKWMQHNVREQADFMKASKKRNNFIES